MEPPTEPPRTWLWRSRAWIGLLILAPSLAAATFSSAYFAPGTLAEISLTSAGWFVFVLGGVWRWWATLYIGGRKDNGLTQSGPYSLCRHPLYLANFLLALSMALFLQSVSFAVAVLGVVLFFLTVTIPLEESRLLKVFGEQYADYRRRVPCFWPRFAAYDTPSAITIEITGLRAEYRRSLRWLAIPVVCHLVLHLRSFEWWPHWLPLS